MQAVLNPEPVFFLSLCLWLIKYPNFLASLGKHHRRKSSLVVFPVFWVCLSLFKQSGVYPEKYEYYERRSFSRLDVPTWTDEPGGPLPLSLDSCLRGARCFCCQCLWEFLPGPRVCLQLLVRGVWDVCGWLFFILVSLSALCSSNSGIISCCSDVLWLSSKETWKCTKSEGFIKSGLLEPRPSFLGPSVTCYNVPWVFVCAVASA